VPTINLLLFRFPVGHIERARPQIRLPRAGDLSDDNALNGQSGEKLPSSFRLERFSLLVLLKIPDDVRADHETLIRLAYLIYQFR
jgi:hypothetical protein